MAPHPAGMSSLTVYRIRPDGSQTCLGVLGNAFGGQPLVWDALADVLDPLTPERELVYWREFGTVLAMRKGVPSGRISGRWMLDNILVGVRPEEDLVPGDTPKLTLERMFLATADSSKDPLYRIAMAATSPRAWIERDSLNLVAAAFRATSRLARSPRVGLAQHVNHLDVLAETMLAEFEAGPEVSLGVRIYWGQADDPGFRNVEPTPEQEADPDFEPDIQEPNFLNPCSVVDFGLWGVLHVGELEDLGFRERGDDGELHPMAATATPSADQDAQITRKWLHNATAVKEAASANFAEGSDLQRSPLRVPGQSGAEYLDMVLKAQEDGRVALLSELLRSGQKLEG